jgi:hypothetical protein
MSNWRAPSVRFDTLRHPAASWLQLQAQGTRAVVAQTLLDEAINVRKAIKHLAVSAGNGDLKSAQALIPWIDQALGKPPERVEVTRPQSLDELAGMEQSQLEALVAEGRGKAPGGRARSRVRRRLTRLAHRSRALWGTPSKTRVFVGSPARGAPFWDPETNRDSGGVPPPGPTA